ncbi:DUF928 domain-containing protein [Allocoleopsis franciscana]|uniref:DUF928 domain-containing protein n=1 Tax=Allocoleopsis franciscana PCC 7113 TaxID=1173027 RepID=K9WI42_9CYAN|nr:DUF928 domain-containing protein [Allocoleopsis franciscana]AFZ19182.1 protein of unknown function (DUF928) [Allocoleopsis franciscana PCC 7113]
MFWTKSRTTLITFCIAFFVGLFLSVVPLQVIAQPSNLQVQGQSGNRQSPAWFTLRLKDERRPLPGRREPAAGRGCGANVPNLPLTALSPETNLGFTIAAYPKFFFYIPQMSATAVKFTLLQEDDNKVYEKTFPSSRISGIFDLRLPDDKSLPPLVVGKNYHWYFQITCPQLGSGDIYVDGWVQRVSRGGQNNLWYDSVATLAEKRRLNPDDSALAAAWENLLRSEGLDKIASQPLMGSLRGEKP